eukprot:Seg1479.7 transcript_id=Seg1479.7/GoldUCD/mRNA.D3Y31 product="hypothetical protein" protein_id=Seg1479.7/GoldUCD/D3Y31
MSKTFILVKPRSDLIEFKYIIMINRFTFNGISFAKMGFEFKEDKCDVESDIKSTLYEINISHVILRGQKDFSGLLARLESKIIVGRQSVWMKECSGDETQPERGDLIDKEGCLRNTNCESCLRVQDCCTAEKEIGELSYEEGCPQNSNNKIGKSCLRVQDCCEDRKKQEDSDSIILDGTSFVRRSSFEHVKESNSRINGNLTEQRAEIKVPANDRLFEKNIRADKSRESAGDRLSGKKVRSDRDIKSAGGKLSEETTGGDKFFEGGELRLEQKETDSSSTILKRPKPKVSDVQARKITQQRTCDRCKSKDLGHFQWNGSCDQLNVETGLKKSKVCSKTLDGFSNAQSYWKVSDSEDRHFVKAEENCQCSEAGDLKQDERFCEVGDRGQEDKKMGLLETSVEKTGTELKCAANSVDRDILDVLESEIKEFNEQIERELKQIDTNLYQYMMINIGYSFLVLKEKVKIIETENRVKRLKMVQKKYNFILNNGDLSPEALQLKREKIEDAFDRELVDWQDDLEILRLRESIIMVDIMIEKQREQIDNGNRLIKNLDEVIQKKKDFLRVLEERVNSEKNQIIIKEKDALQALEEHTNSEDELLANNNDNENFGASVLRQDGSTNNIGFRFKYSCETDNQHLEEECKSRDHGRLNNGLIYKGLEPLDTGKERNSTFRIPLSFENDITDDNTAEEPKKKSGITPIPQTDITIKETYKKANFLTDLDKSMVIKNKTEAHEQNNASKQVLEHQNDEHTEDKHKKAIIYKENHPAIFSLDISSLDYETLHDSYLDYKCRRWIKRLTVGSNLLRVPVEKYQNTKLTNHMKGAPRALGRSKRGKSRSPVKDTIYQSDIVEV